MEFGVSMLSVIIPITGENRKEQVKTSLHFLRNQTLTNYEIILVEQIDALLGGKNLGGPFYTDVGVDQYVKIKGPGKNHFNQPWMANVGARIAKGNKFLFLDIDMVFARDYLENVYNYNKPFFIAYSKVHMLTRQGSNIVRRTNEITEDARSGAEVHESGALKYAGFSACSKRDFFFSVLGGYNENYLGWGGNDNDIAWRSLTILNEEYSLDKDIFHLWHPKEYSKFLVWERKSVWFTTHNHPQAVTERLKLAHIGKKEQPTFIELKDIFVDARKMKQN